MRDLDSELWNLGLSTGEYVKFDGSNFVGDIPSSNNIGNADLIIDATGERKLVMAGALSTDFFSIKNSADTQPLFKVQGDGVVQVGNGTPTANRKFNLFGVNNSTTYSEVKTTFTSGAGELGHTLNIGSGGNAKFWMQYGTGFGNSTSGGVHHNGSTFFYLTQGTNGKGHRFSYLSGANIPTTTDSAMAMQIAPYNSGVSGGVVSIGTALGTGASGIPSTTYGNNVFILKKSPNLPSANYTDTATMYVDDIVAGNSAPHFRTELGDIIKLYKEAALTASDGTTLANVITRVDELEARLQNQGLLT